MAKSNKPTTKQHFLSPENYIKTKGRSLPIFECLINSDWNERKMANIVISRKHTNGNVTFCVYLVDLLCVGVKTTYFGFNFEMDEYKEFTEKLKVDLGTQSVDYALAHNIIYGSIVFSSVYEILPHKDFLKTTQYFLEEDTEDFEIIDVEFGRKFIPFFIANDFYTKAQANIIIQKLEKVLGKGNVDYVFGDFDPRDLDDNHFFDDEDFDDEDFNDEDFDENDIDDDEDKEKDERYTYFESLKPQERKELFEKMAKEEGLYDHHDSIIDLIKIANTIVYRDLSDKKVVESFLYKWDKEFNLLIVDESILETLIRNSELDRKLLNLIPKLTNQLTSGSHKQNVKLKKDLQKYLDNPYICYLYLQLLENERNETEYHQQLDAFCSLFPHYPLLKIENVKRRKMQGEIITAKDILPNIIFKGQESVTDFEMYQYLILKMSVECKPKLFNVIQAIESWSLELPIGEEYQKQFLFYIQMMKIEYLKRHFNNEL